MALRAAAFEELLERGPRGLTMTGVAQRAYFSVGSAYQRWDDKPALLRDLAAEVILPSVRELAAECPCSASSPGDWMRTWLEDPRGIRCSLAVVTLILAAQDNESLVPLAAEAARTMSSQVAAADVTDLSDDSANAARGGLCWWMTSLALGQALLDAAGAVGPRGAESLAGLLSRLNDRLETGDVGQERQIPEAKDLRWGLPEGMPEDSSATALIKAGRELIAEQGIGAATTRNIAERADVTTGKIYRRYADRDALLKDIFTAEFHPKRHVWEEQILENISVGGDSERTAELMARLTRRIFENAESARVILELLCAGMESPSLAQGISETVRAAADARVAAFDDMTDLGVLKSDISNELLAWLVSWFSVGSRLMGSAGISPTDEQLFAVTRRMALVVH